MERKLTIVGPEPTAPEGNRRSKGVNIEALLLMGKYDARFRKKLFADRAKALAQTGLGFSAGERLLLSHISDEQLSQNIKEFRVAGVSRKSLPTWARAAAVVLLLTSLLLSDTTCEPPSRSGVDPDAGIAPDSTEVEHVAPAGISPDPPIEGISPD